MELFEKLKTDPELFYAYQANIAMAFKDEYYNYKKFTKNKYMNEADIHVIANNAAINFLNLLIKE